MTSTGNQNVFFSIIVPAYNVERYIHRAISSILNQSFQDFELIIVNDGSTDNTTSVINEFLIKNQKIIVVNHPKNESQHIARMDGVVIATGEYIIFLDADDYFTEDAFNILHDVIQKKPGYEFYEYGYIQQPSGERILPFFEGNDRFLDFFANKNNPAHTMWNKVYDAKLLKKAFAAMKRAYIDNAEDLYESIVIAFYAKSEFKIHEIITNYAIGTGVSTSYKDYDKTINCLRSAKKTFELIQIFLDKVNKNMNTYNLSKRIMEYIIFQYINMQKKPEDKKLLLLKLSDYFDSRIVLEYLVDQETTLNNRLRSTRGSLDYKLGHKILWPLRKARYFFKRK